MLQIRVTDFDGSNPIILENASNRVFSDVISSADGGVSFSIAKNDPKADVLNPNTTGYTKRWECWDTATNRRLNYGPFTDIADEPGMWKVTGAGRAAYLQDFYKTKKTFYAPMYSIVEDISYENLAAQPRTTTLVPSVTTSAAQTTVFGNTVQIDERYHGLSTRTKDNAIDDDNGQFRVNDIEPPNTYYSNDTYWSGMSVGDTHIVDLGDVYDVKRLIYTLPEWGGPTKRYNRTYDYEIAIATDEGSTTEVQDREFGTFTTIFSTDTPSRVVGGIILYIGDDGSGIEVVPDLQPDSPTFLNLPPVPVRYVRMKITDVHAWFGTHFDDDASIDGWEWQCDPDYVEGSIAGRDGPGMMTEDINDRVLEPANDCHASITEVEVSKEIINLYNVKPLARQRIDNNNPQITYFHAPAAGETKTTSSGYRKFEPGSFFRKIKVTYSGASGGYTKFFDSDCSGCYPDGFNFGIINDGNSLVYSTDTGSRTNYSITMGARTRNVTMKGAANAVITYCDAWPAKLDQFSWGGSYSYTEVEDDYATIHFRGQSFRWYATVPASKTGATVDLEIREKTTGNWSSFTPLTSFQLPNDIAAQLVYEIPYESGLLEADTTYEIRITNADGGYCSIDSIEGFWSASMAEYNEDSSRIFISDPSRIKQIYDKRFSNGSMFKFTSAGFAVITFTGDRVIALSAKGRNHGKVRVLLLDDTAAQGLYDPGVDTHVFIPGGDPDDGSLLIDLDTGKTGEEIPQYVLFDSADYFTSGLPWGSYSLGIYYLNSDVETYTSNTADIEFDSFVGRCKDCEAPTGDDVTVRKPIFLDGFFVHEMVGLSIAFNNDQHLDILKAVAEATGVEWCVDNDGITVEPRIGQDTNIYLREGENTLVDWGIVHDISEMATMLLSHGADIDGLPLFTITENKETRARMGRTIMRQQDFRNLASFFQLVGLSRTELMKRAFPVKRINVSHIANDLDLQKGDSFVLWTKKGDSLRVRIIRREINESGGRVYNLECVTWPQIS